MTKYCVLFLIGKKEHQTPWFASQERARLALKLMQLRHGDKNCIIYVD